LPMNGGFDHGVGHPVLSVLFYSSSWRAEGRWWYLDGCQDRGKHRARLLPEKALRRRGSISTREEEVMNRSQTGPLSGMIEAAELMVPQRQMPVAAHNAKRPGPQTRRK
jgi:hypothetical protein